MAYLGTGGGYLWLRLTGEEQRAFCQTGIGEERGDGWDAASTELSSSLRVALCDVVEVRVVRPAWLQVEGLHLGDGFAEEVIAGFFHARVDTVAVCHGFGPGVRITCAGEHPVRIVATVDDPARVARRISGAMKKYGRPSSDPDPCYRRAERPLASRH